MSILTTQDLQQLQDHLSLIEAACHIIGVSVTRLTLDAEHSVWLCAPHPPPDALQGLLLQALHTLQQAVNTQQLHVHPYPDADEPLIAVAELQHWLAAHQLFPAFFFGPPAPQPDYLNPQHPRYAPKLALAICAWQESTEWGKGSAKQALERSLRVHAAAYGQVHADGQPIQQVIEECGKVANWQLKGGAPRSA